MYSFDFPTAGRDGDDLALLLLDLVRRIGAKQAA